MSQWWQWLELLLQTKTVLGSTPGQGLSVWSLPGLPVPAWVLSEYSGLFPQSNNMQTEGEINWSF